MSSSPSLLLRVAASQVICSAISVMTSTVPSTSKVRKSSKMEAVIWVLSDSSSVESMAVSCSGRKSG